MKYDFLQGSQLDVSISLWPAMIRAHKSTCSAAGHFRYLWGQTPSLRVRALLRTFGFLIFREGVTRIRWIHQNHDIEHYSNNREISKSCSKFKDRPLTKPINTSRGVESKLNMRWTSTGRQPTFRSLNLMYIKAAHMPLITVISSLCLTEKGSSAECHKQV